MEKQLSTVEKILKYGLAAVLITPLVIGESLIFPLISTKAFFFYIVVDIIFVCYLLILRRQALYPKKNKLLLFFLGLTILSFIIDLLGINFRNSFWGNYERMTGIYTSLHLILYLWILLSVYNTKEKFLKLLDVSVIVSFLVSIYGVLQKAGIYFFGIIRLTDTRVESTLGNPAFLAGYLLIHLFFIVYLFLYKKNLYWRIAYAVFFLFDLGILFSTATRGALVGLAFACLVMIGFFIIFSKQKKARLISLGLLVVLAVSVASIFIFKDSNLVKNNVTLHRISVISPNDPTSKSRLLLWRMSFRAAQERLVFGYGANNMRIPLDKYHDYDLIEDWFDSSHNKFLDELLAHGIIGFGLYLILIFWIFKEILKIRKEDFKLSLILIGLFTAYVIQSFFIFDPFAVSIFFIFMLGFVIVLTNKEKMIIDKKIPSFISYLLIAAIVVVTPIIYIRSINAAKYIISAYHASNTDLDQAVELLRKADETLIYGRDILAPAMAETLMELLSRPGNYKKEDVESYANLLSQVYEKAIKESSNYSKFYINWAKMYQLLDKTLDQGLIEKSFPLLEKALEYSPNRIDVYYVFAQGYYNLGEYDIAVAKLKEALELGVRQADIYTRLAEVYIRGGEVDKFLDAVDNIYNLETHLSSQDLERYAKIMVEKEEWEGALAMFLRMNQADPENIDICYNIALSYKKLGEKEKAEEWANKIVGINPFKAAEMEVFISNL